MFTTIRRVSEPAPEKPYPKLMVSHENTLVMFTSRCKGMCLDKGNAHSAKLGEICDTWCSHNFKDYVGTLTIENK